MTINPARYRKRHRRDPLMINIRLRRRGRKPTALEVLDVLRSILETHVVPDGWQFAAIDWKHPRAASSGWRHGRLHDFAALQYVVEAALESARVAIVRETSPTLTMDETDDEDY